MQAAGKSFWRMAVLLVALACLAERASGRSRAAQRQLGSLLWLADAAAHALAREAAPAWVPLPDEAPRDLSCLAARLLALAGLFFTLAERMFALARGSAHLSNGSACPLHRHGNNARRVIPRRARAPPTLRHPMAKQRQKAGAQTIGSMP